MTNKRLDGIECQLTPKQWAIKLADDMRRYPSEEDFLRAIAKGTYRQSPYAKPFHMLAKQAEQRWPERGGEKARVELNRKLRMEFHALKMLINNLNEAIKSKANTSRLKAELQLSKLKTLILQDALERTGVVETISAGSASQVRLRLSSLLEDWADESAILLLDTAAYKAAVLIVQERHFDDHLILFKDIETSLEVTIRTVRDTIFLFDEYQRKAADPLSGGPNQESQKDSIRSVVRGERQANVSIDIEAIEKRGKMLAGVIVDEWVTTATNKGKADILKETGRHEDFLWQSFRKSVGLESRR
jgi:hypothetical protein